MSVAPSLVVSNTYLTRTTSHRDRIAMDLMWFLALCQCLSCLSVLQDSGIAYAHGMNRGADNIPGYSTVQPTDKMNAFARPSAWCSVYRIPKLAAIRRCFNQKTPKVVVPRSPGASVLRTTMWYRGCEYTVLAYLSFIPIRGSR